MIFSNRTKHLSLSLLLAASVTPRALGLLNLEGSRNQIYVTGGLSYQYDSNIFYDSTQQADSSLTARIGLEAKRRAGTIGINASAKLDYQWFSKFTGENSLNPNFLIEFTKSTGRTTGSFSVNIYRETRSDSAVNLRTNSWNLPLALSLRYPVNEKFYLTSQTGYLQRRYSENNALTDYEEFSESVDLFRRYSSKLDLSGGYRIRVSNTTIGPRTFDHWFNVGATGGIWAKINGTIRFGYQIRDLTAGERYNQFNALAALNWTVSRKLAVSGQVSRDFNTIANGASVDSTSTTLRVSYALSRKAGVDSGLGYGRNTFLGSVPRRRDDFFSWDLSGNYKLNDHLRLAASYAYLQNWSTFSTSDFDRHAFTFEISSNF